jgi:two-component system, chemotaxis family, sensor kinase CheA
MDISQYLPMFLAEAREHLQELNLAIVRIEEDPDDRATVDEIFRIAHSLKGMSATMGFASVAALTHEMENVFELLRERRGGLEREAITVLLECLDALGVAVEAIDVEGVEKIDEGPLIERLQGLVRNEDGDEEETGEEPETALVEDDLEELAGGGRVLHAVVHFGEDVLMPAVRAYMVLAALGEHGQVVRSLPRETEVDAFDGKVVEAWLTSEHEEQAIERTLIAIADVSRVSVVPEGTEQKPKPAAATVEAKSAGPLRKASSTVRVDAERLDQLMHLMGELVVHRTAVESLAVGADVPGLQQAMQDLTRSSQALQAMVMQVRMIPVEAVFLRFPRLVRDLSQKLGKKVELVLSGQDTELDRTVVDALGDPLVHLVRNALDHGLEPADDRVAAGKPETGSLEISARHAGGNVVISVRDDGRGIDPQHVARKAAARGLIPVEAIEAIDMHRAAELLFAPGFSTAEQTSDVSGRGVGMDVVRATIRELGGEVFLTSEIGRGTTAQIRLPLTLAIMAALLVETDGLPFAIQLDRVERTLRLESEIVRSVAGQRMLVERDGVLPLVDLSAALGYAPAVDAGHAVIVRGADRRLAVAVSLAVGQRELVTRPLPPELAGRAAFSGGAVLSNGEIALIVDCDALAHSPGAIERSGSPGAIERSGSPGAIERSGSGGDWATTLNAA